MVVKIDNKKEMGELHQLRKAKLYVTTAKAAVMLDRDITWVQKNKDRFPFNYRRKNQRRNLEFELSSVLEVWQNLQRNRVAS